MSGSEPWWRRAQRLAACWRLGLHFLFGTTRFGVNNRRSETFSSWLRRPLFGFGWTVLLMPWKWVAVIAVVRLRLQIAGLWFDSSGGRGASPPATPIDSIRGSCSAPPGTPIAVHSNNK